MDVDALHLACLTCGGSQKCEHVEAVEKQLRSAYTVDRLRELAVEWTMDPEAVAREITEFLDWLAVTYVTERFASA